MQKDNKADQDDNDKVKADDDDSKDIHSPMPNAASASSAARTPVHAEEDVPGMKLNLSFSLS